MAVTTCSHHPRLTDFVCEQTILKTRIVPVFIGQSHLFTNCSPQVFGEQAVHINSLSVSRSLVNLFQFIERTEMDGSE